MQGIDLQFLFMTSDGRINRQRWWIGVGILFGVSLIATALFGNQGLIPFAIGILLLIAGIMLHIKRCHDRDKSGWWCLLLAIPFVNVIWAIIDLGILEGTRGENRFGPDPLASA